MRLNLYEILQHVLLTEGASSNEVNHAIDNQYRVYITYDDEVKSHRGAKGTRFIEPYVYGLTKAGNPCLRAYQYYGSTFRGTPKWKLFRLDRITNWQETDQHFTITPRENGWNAEEYNRDGDLSMSSVVNMVHTQNYNQDDNYSPNDSLYTARARTQQMQTSTAPTVNDVPTNSGAVPNSTTNDVVTKNNQDFGTNLKHNMDITAQEKEKNNFDVSKLLDYPKRRRIIPQDGQSIEDARLQRKRERDREWHRKKREQQQLDRFNREPIRSPKRYRTDDDINDDF